MNYSPSLSPSSSLISLQTRAHPDSTQNKEKSMYKESLEWEPSILRPSHQMSNGPNGAIDFASSKAFWSNAKVAQSERKNRHMFHTSQIDCRGIY